MKKKKRTVYEDCEEYLEELDFAIEDRKIISGILPYDLIAELDGRQFVQFFKIVEFIYKNGFQPKDTQ